MSLGDVLFLMGFAAVVGGVVGWEIATEREFNRWSRNRGIYSLPTDSDRRPQTADQKGGVL